MSPAICFNLEQSKILLSGNGLKTLNEKYKDTSNSDKNKEYNNPQSRVPIL